MWVGAVKIIHEIGLITSALIHAPEKTQTFAFVVSLAPLGNNNSSLIFHMPFDDLSHFLSINKWMICQFYLINEIPGKGEIRFIYNQT